MSNQPGSGTGSNYFGWGANFPQSVAIVFDIYQNGNDPSIPYMGIAMNGNPFALAANTGPSRAFSNGNTWYCWLDYIGSLQTLQLRLSSTPTRPNLATIESSINLDSIIQQPKMYLGFGGGSGGDYSVPQIYSWSFSVSELDDSIFLLFGFKKK